MDINKEREAFESWWEAFHNGRQIACDYVEEDNSYSVGYANAQWVAWQAKAQAVPEGFVLVPKEPTDKTIARMINTPIEVNLLCDHADIFLSEGEAYIAYQAMIEAQEPAND